MRHTSDLDALHLYGNRRTGQAPRQLRVEIRMHGFGAIGRWGLFREQGNFPRSGSHALRVPSSMSPIRGYERCTVISTSEVTMTIQPTILCPVDFSTASAGALRYAAFVAAHFKAPHRGAGRRGSVAHRGPRPGHRDHLAAGGLQARARQLRREDFRRRLRREGRRRM